LNTNKSECFRLQKPDIADSDLFAPICESRRDAEINLRIKIISDRQAMDEVIKEQCSIMIIEIIF